MTQNRSTRRSLLATSLALAATAALPQFAHAQAYPSKPITFVVPFAAGSATDQLKRHGPGGRRQEDAGQTQLWQR